jgi:hypothetical protein
MTSIGGMFESSSTVPCKIIDGVSRQQLGVAARSMSSFSIPVYQMTIQLHMLPERRRLVNAVNHIRINTYWYNTSRFLYRRQLPFKDAIAAFR